MIAEYKPNEWKQTVKHKTWN